MLLLLQARFKEGINNASIILMNIDYVIKV